MLQSLNVDYYENESYKIWSYGDFIIDFAMTLYAASDKLPENTMTTVNQCVKTFLQQLKQASGKSKLALAKLY